MRWESNNGEFANRQQFVGDTLRGEVIDTSKENPVIRPIRDAPVVIVEEEPAEDYEKGEMLAVEITNATENALFGELVEEDHDDEHVDYRVEFMKVGHRFKSEKFSDRDVAEDVCEYIRSTIDDSAEVKRYA